MKSFVITVLTFSSFIFAQPVLARPNISGVVAADVSFVTLLPDHENKALFYAFPSGYSVCGGTNPEFSFHSFVAGDGEPNAVVDYNLCPYHNQFEAAERALKSQNPEARLMFIPYDSLIAGHGLWRAIFDDVEITYQCLPIRGSQDGKVACQISSSNEAGTERLYDLFADSSVLVLNGYFDRIFAAVERKEAGELLPVRIHDTVAFGLFGMKNYPHLLKIEWSPAR